MLEHGEQKKSHYQMILGLFLPFHFRQYLFFIRFGISNRYLQLLAGTDERI